MRIFRFEKHHFQTHTHNMFYNKKTTFEHTPWFSNLTGRKTSLRPVNSQKTISFNPVTFPPRPRLDVYNIQK